MAGHATRRRPSARPHGAHEMTAVVVRGFFSRRLRAVLTGIAVALGVALMSGTYILTDTIDHSFATIFATGAQNRAVVVVPHQGLGANAAVQTATIGQATLARVRRVPGVARRRRRGLRDRDAVRRHGKRLNTLGAELRRRRCCRRASRTSPPSRDTCRPTPARSRSTRRPRSATSLKLGQRLRVAGATAAASYRIVGILTFAGLDLLRRRRRRAGHRRRRRS